MDGEWFGLWADSTEEEIAKAKADPKWGTMTPQAEAGLETLDLYCWWKFIRPLRKEPMDVSGLSDYYDRKRAEGKAKDPDYTFLDGLDEPAGDDWHELHEKCDALEKQYENEDEANMIRLIKLRRSLWT